MRLKKLFADDLRNPDVPNGLWDRLGIFSLCTHIYLLFIVFYLNCIFTTGIGNRALRPLLGIVDPLHMKYMPNRVATYSGFDVLW